MDELDFSEMEPKEAAAYAQKFSIDELQARAAEFSPDQAALLVSRLLPQTDTQWQEKLHSFLCGIDERHVLECIGCWLTIEQMLCVLSLAAKEHKPLRRHLEAILVGFPQERFLEVMRLADASQLRILRDLGAAESMQHHLTVLLHALTHKAEQEAADLELVERQVEQYNLTEGVRQRDIDHMMDRIEQTLDFFHSALNDIDLSLGIAWNSSRQDLIERFTALKENWLRYLQHFIGYPASHSGPATALFGKIEDKMNSLFQLIDGQNNKGGLEDDDPAIEGLTALDLWYAVDYWELGLLPGIAVKEQLALDPALHNESERATYKKKLQVAARNNLDAIGLHIVADLKREHIYSRRILARYIEKHKAKLLPASSYSEA